MRYPTLPSSLFVQVLPVLTAPRARLFASATPTVETTQSFQKLSSKLQTITRLQRLSALANWDQLVMMPQSDENHGERGAQLAALAGVVHAQSTAPELRDLIASAEEEAATLDAREQATVREAKRDFDRQAALPAELAERQAALTSEAYAVWTKAREASDYAAFAPTLDKCFATAREVAACRSDGDAYDESLQSFERGMSGDRIAELFGAVQARLTPLLRDCLAAEHQPSTAPLSAGAGSDGFAVEKQQQLSSAIVGALGLQMGSHARLDLSVHPFSTSFGPNDVRITTRFDEREWYQGLAGSIHEAGHSMYEAGLRATALPVDCAVSMGVHESQSLFWERHVGLSRPFWTWAGPQVRETLGVAADDDALYAAANAVQAQSLIRVEADELSYPMHVILRFEIERALLRGELAVGDVPATWNARMGDLLGVTPEIDAKGCLQDVHWSSLAIGYFPSYLLGAMMAAQLQHYCRAALPQFDELLAKGDFKPILAWLRTNVHDQGLLHPSMDALLEHACGEPLNPEYFLGYLEDKYRALYRLDA